jgi:hypothetical protein
MSKLNLLKNLSSGALHLLGNGVKAIASKFKKTPEDRIKAADESLERSHQFQAQRDAAGEAFRRRNPNASDEQVAAYLDKEGLIEPKTPLEQTSSTFLKKGFAAATIVAVVGVPSLVGIDLIGAEDGHPSRLARVIDNMTDQPYKRADGTEFEIGPLLSVAVENIYRDPERRLKFQAKAHMAYNPMREYFFFLKEREDNNKRSKIEAARDSLLTGVQADVDTRMAINQAARICMSRTGKSLDECRTQVTAQLESQAASASALTLDR